MKEQFSLKQSSDSKQWYGLWSITREGKTRVLLTNLYENVVSDLVSDGVFVRLECGEEVVVEVTEVAEQGVMDLGG